MGKEENYRERDELAGREKIGQDELYDFIMKPEPSWQSIIYELIRTEQLDPWDIDIGLLTQRYLERLKELEEEHFHISGKLLLVASLLLRLKAELLLDHYIPSIDEILFGKKEERPRESERLEINDDELPLLLPKTPLPRARRVTLQELMQALEKAVNTETRRIKREIVMKRRFEAVQIVLPRQKINIREKIEELYRRIKSLFIQRKSRISFSEIAKDREEKLVSFLPLLHLDSQKRIWLEQEKHFDEIWIWLYHIFVKKLKEIEGAKELKRDISVMRQELDAEQEKRLQKLKNEFNEPLANLFCIFDSL